jgi:hypothetical protein
MSLAQHNTCASGLPDCSWFDFTKSGENIPKDHKITKWPYNMPTFSISRHSRIYPNWDFWFENIPSGNPVHACMHACMYVGRWCSIKASSRYRDLIGPNWMMVISKALCCLYQTRSAYGCYVFFPKTKLQNAKFSTVTLPKTDQIPDFRNVKCSTDQMFDKSLYRTSFVRQNKCPTSQNFEFWVILLSSQNFEFWIILSSLDLT